MARMTDFIKRYRPTADVEVDPASNEAALDDFFESVHYSDEPEFSTDYTEPTGLEATRAKYRKG